MTSKNFYGSGYQSGLMNSKLFLNSVYSSGEAQVKKSDYIFKDRSGRLKWKELMKLDLEGMIRSSDITPLEGYLENLVFSSIEENDMQLVPESSVLKLVKINQYIMEYLLDTQHRLEYENKVLEANYTQLFNDSVAKENILKQNKSLIYTLKKDKKEKESVLNTYKCLIDEYKLKGEDGVKRYFYCKLCEGKKFSTRENLESHYNRRHGNINAEDDRSFTKESGIENKFDKMKNYFETFIKNYHNESNLKIFENQKTLENKLAEIKYEKNIDIKDIESHFKNTLIEMKEMYLKNSMLSSGNNIGGSYITKEPDDNLTNKIKKETERMNEMLQEMSKEQNTKIQNLLEGFSQFKSNMTDVLKDIKDKPKPEVTEIENLTLRRSRANKKDTQINLALTNIESLQYTSTKPAKLDLIKESIFNELIGRKKPLFNSGPLESDSEHSSEEKKRKFKNSSLNIQNRAESIEIVKFSFGPEKESPFKDFVISAEENKKESAISEVQDVREVSASSIKTLDKFEKPESKLFEIPSKKDLSSRELTESTRLIKDTEVNQNHVEDVVVTGMNEAETKQITMHNNKEKLKEFYESFVLREEKIIDSPLLENYNLNIIAQRGNIETKVESQLGGVMKAYVNDDTGAGLNLEGINKKSDKEIMEMFDNILKNLDSLSKKKDYFEYYYQDISKAVDLDSCISFVNDKRLNQDYFSPKNINTLSKVQNKSLEKEETVSKISDNQIKSAKKEDKLDSEFDHDI